jgi:hypothetical protein
MIYLAIALLTLHAVIGGVYQTTGAKKFDVFLNAVMLGFWAHMVATELG